MSQYYFRRLSFILAIISPSLKLISWSSYPAFLQHLLFSGIKYPSRRLSFILVIIFSITKINFMAVFYLGPKYPARLSARIFFTLQFSNYIACSAVLSFCSHRFSVYFSNNFAIAKIDFMAANFQLGRKFKLSGLYAKGSVSTAPCMTMVRRVESNLFRRLYIVLICTHTMRKSG